MKKPKASLEPFWDLKISKYVEYPANTIQYKLSATFSEKYRWLNLRVFLAYVMSWINKASLALYIARIIVKGLARARLQQRD